MTNISRDFDKKKVLKTHTAVASKVTLSICGGDQQ